MYTVPGEYPRPNLFRPDWQLLNGPWSFAFDDDEAGQTERWYDTADMLDRTIEVPFCYQTKRSGIRDTRSHECIWYKRAFDLDPPLGGKRLFLRFGAVDYQTDVWLNGVFLGGHTGGYTPFSFEITDDVRETQNILTVKVIDRNDPSQPRGKQYWEERPDRCWYVPSSGIWQSVWLESVPDNYITDLRMTPDIDTNCCRFEITTEMYTPEDEIGITVSFGGQVRARTRVMAVNRYNRICVQLREEDYIDEIHYWSPEQPNLYEVELTLFSRGEITDRVQSYFGMRKISAENGTILLNNSPYYQKLILDQGYWPETHLTPPDEEAIKFDIMAAKAMGFNGVRKHQKIEDPRFYYWADRLGLLVWGEMPSAYFFTPESSERMAAELQAFISRDYNHPCIVAWVLLNESWGVRKLATDPKQQAFSKMLYHTAKAFDQTRLVSTNDGWENINTDIATIHDYAQSGSHFSQYASVDNMDAVFPCGWRLFVPGETYGGQPIMITEYGGVAPAEKAQDENWGYDTVDDEAAFIRRYAELTRAVMALPYICGFCYTQLTDVQQEVNGLLDEGRNFKVDKTAICRINNGEALPELDSENPL